MTAVETAKRKEIRKTAVGTMHALVFYRPGLIAWEKVPKPAVQKPTDAVVRLLTTTICGTDLHILKGDVPEVRQGRVLGHEGIGIVEEAGAAVSRVKPGDKVLISCITSCAKCAYCRKGMYSHCQDGGWMLGRAIDGTQAEYVRIPYADTSLHLINGDKDPDLLVFLSDVFPTAFECGVLNGKVEPGDTVAVVGAGPIGLAALITAKLYSPARLYAVDTDSNRLELAEKLGAVPVSNAGGAAAEDLLRLTGGAGVDVAMEAVGVPSTFELCQSLLKPGGRLASIGVFGKSVTLHLEELWSKNVTITTRLVDTVSTPLLLSQVRAGKLSLGGLDTHRFALSEILKAYETFGHAAQDRALKILLNSRD